MRKSWKTYIWAQKEPLIKSVPKEVLLLKRFSSIKKEPNILNSDKKKDALRYLRNQQNSIHHRIKREKLSGFYLRRLSLRHLIPSWGIGSWYFYHCFQPSHLFHSVSHSVAGCLSYWAVRKPDTRSTDTKNAGTVGSGRHQPMQMWKTWQGASEKGVHGHARMRKLYTLSKARTIKKSGQQQLARI